MHVAQIMLTEADDHDEAISIVSSQLTEEHISPRWSDWHGGFDNCLAGRWAGQVFGSAHPDEVMRYVDEPELAEKVIAEWLGARKEDLAFNLNQLKEGSFDLKTFAENFEVESPKTEENDFWGNQMRLWYAKSILDTLSYEWTSSSGVYDLVEQTARLNYFRERLEDPKRKEKQHLVVVDFHF